MSDDYKSAAFRSAYGREFSDRAALISSHAYAVCKLDKALPGQFSPEQAECVNHTAQHLWTFFKAADLQLQPAFFE